MTLADRIRRTTVLISVLFCVSLVSPIGALAAPDGDGPPGNSAAAHDKKEDAPGAPAATTSPAPDESTTVALESSAPAGNGNGNAGGSSSDNANAGGGNAGGINSNGKKADPTTTTTTSATTSTSSGSGSNGGGNGGGNGKATGGANGGSNSGSGGGGGNANDGGNGGNGTVDPDPAPVGTPPSTTGPNTCDGDGKQQGGPYDHDNCDGTQGQHGNGGNGKCAGCTGRADDKAPGGQQPGDHNNGYECDNNRGVGKGNPAHSKCKPKTDTNCTTNCNQCTSNCNQCTSNCNQCTSNCNGCQGNCNPGCQVDCNPGCQVDCTPGCQTDCNPGNPGCQGPTCDPDEVLGKVIHQALPKTTQNVLPARVRGAALPYTGAGSSLIPLMSLGLLLMTIGGLAVGTSARGRRKATQTT